MNEKKIQMVDFNVEINEGSSYIPQVKLDCRFYVIRHKSQLKFIDLKKLKELITQSLYESVETDEEKDGVK